jgi:hypothetical protein
MICRTMGSRSCPSLELLDGARIPAGFLPPQGGAANLNVARSPLCTNPIRARTLAQNPSCSACFSFGDRSRAYPATRLRIRGPCPFLNQVYMTISPPNLEPESRFYQRFHSRSRPNLPGAIRVPTLTVETQVLVRKANILLSLTAGKRAMEHPF